MAKTQEFYRLGGRLPRYTTQLSSFANGMYLTNQVIPESYAKELVNFDIDDTGSHIKPRRGRRKTDVITYKASKLGAASITDYLYLYNKDLSEVIDTKDVVLSYGLFTKLTDLTPNAEDKKAYYITDLIEAVDSNFYIKDPETGEYVVEGEQKEPVTTHINEFWGLAWNKEEERFEKINNAGLGSVPARLIDQAYAFNKPFKSYVGRPVGTVLNNELITFVGGSVSFNKFLNNSERNQVSSLGNLSLSKVKFFKDTNGMNVRSDKIIPKTLNPLDAYSSGYNLLLENPYLFKNTVGGTLSILGATLHKNEQDKNPIFLGTLGEPIYIKLYYQFPEEGKTIKLKVESYDATATNPTKEVLEDFTVTHTAAVNSPIVYAYTPMLRSTIVRFTVRLGDDNTTDYVAEINITCGTTKYDGLTTSSFDLSTCKGMVAWQGRVGIYGISAAKDLIIFSDAEDPGYFPFPNNILIFDNEILAVHNYLDNLIVVTVDSIWMVTPGSTVLTSTQKRILANIHIPEIDAINLVVLKDQIFFKTDTQFYVLKPNTYTSDATDLKNYVNSTAIANFTSDFQNNVVRLLNEVYRDIWQRLTKEHRKDIKFIDFDVLDTHSVVKNEFVHYIYTITPILTDSIVVGNVDLHLVYNTLNRSWKLYFVAVGSEVNNYKPVWHKNKQSGQFYEFFTHVVPGEEPESEIVVACSTYDTVDDNLEDGDWHLTDTYNNYQYLDTGNVSLEDVNTKRFREVQFNIMNLENSRLNFHTTFKVDGVEQVSSTEYEVQHITDSSDPDYGKLLVIPVEFNNMFVPGVTALSGNNNEDFWTLDMSKFPDLCIATVRLTLQGRGRRCSLQLLNNSLERYELANVNWVYRTMSAR